jgi:hypothetical protein
MSMDMGFRWSFTTLTTFHSWGHLRPAIAVCASILAANNDIKITIMIPSILAKPAAIELQRYPVDYARLQVIHGGKDHSVSSGLRNIAEMHQSIETMNMALEEIFSHLLAVCLLNRLSLSETLSVLILQQHKPIKDNVTQENITPFEIPVSVVIVDLVYGFIIDMLKGIASRAHANVKFVMQAPLSAPFGVWYANL